jgi:hypothetical protein
MVAVNRKYHVKKVYDDNDMTTGGLSVGLGGYHSKHDSTSSWNSYGSYQYTSSSLSSSQQYTNNPYSMYCNQQQQVLQSSVGQFQRILQKVFLIVLVVTTCSWTIARRATIPEQIEVTQLEDKLKVTSDHVQHIFDNIRTIRNKMLSEKIKFHELTETRRLLVEVTSTGMNNGNNHVEYNINNNGNNSNIIVEQKSTTQKWINEQQSTLSDKVKSLQSDLQASSRRTVEEM